MLLQVIKMSKTLQIPETTAVSSSCVTLEMQSRSGNGVSGVARGGGQGEHAPPQLLPNLFFEQLISGNLSRCPGNVKKCSELRKFD